MLDAEGYERGILRLIRLRWVASAVALTALVIASALRPGLRLWPAIVVAALIPASNLGHRALARRGHSSRLLLLAQFLVDLLLLTALLGLLGGVDGPTVPLYLFHVLLAALLLERRDAATVAAIAVGMLGTMAALQLAGAPFPVRDVNLFSSFLRVETPLSQLTAFVASQAVMFTVVASVIFVLVLPLVREARERGRRLELAEAQARSQVMALESILDSAGAMMMMLDDRHTVTWLNRGARERFPGIAAGQVRRCFDPAEPMGGQEPPRCPTCRVLETGQSWTGDYALAVTGALPKVLRVYATPLAAGAATASVVELILDVTEQRDTERKLLEALKTAAIAQLASGVAHELNTPLASLAAGIRSVRRACDACANQDAESRRIAALLADLASQTHRCQRVTESLLGYSRQLRSRLEAAELGAIVDGALKDLSSRRDLNGIEVVHQAPDAATPPVLCDPDHLQLVLVALLTNAVDAVVKAARKKGRVHVCVRVPPGRDATEILVTDNGLGIPPEIRERIFDPFFTTKPVGEGTGLGLAVSRGMLDGMGATVTAESEPGQGARVIVRLRTAPATLAGPVWPMAEPPEAVKEPPIHG